MYKRLKIRTQMSSFRTSFSFLSCPYLPSFGTCCSSLDLSFISSFMESHSSFLFLGFHLQICIIFSYNFKMETCQMKVLACVCCLESKECLSFIFDKLLLFSIVFLFIFDQVLRQFLPNGLFFSYLSLFFLYSLGVCIFNF